MTAPDDETLYGTARKGIRIPPWWLALRVDDIEAVYKVFRDLLKRSAVSHDELAKKLGVNESTVSRWAMENSSPSLEQTKQIVALLEARAARVPVRVRRTRHLLDAIDEAVLAWQTCRNGTGVLHRRMLAARNVHELLERRCRQRSPTREV
jgi:DNA-binding XRE family transcriptional regulator